MLLLLPRKLPALQLRARRRFHHFHVCGQRIPGGIVQPHAFHQRIDLTPAQAHGGRLAHPAADVVPAVHHAGKQADGRQVVGPDDQLFAFVILQIEAGCVRLRLGDGRLGQRARAGPEFPKRD